MPDAVRGVRRGTSVTPSVEVVKIVVVMVEDEVAGTVAILPVVLIDWLVTGEVFREDVWVVRLSGDSEGHRKKFQVYEVGITKVQEVFYCNVSAEHEVFAMVIS